MARYVPGYLLGVTTLPYNSGMRLLLLPLLILTAASCAPSLLPPVGPMPPHRSFVGPWDSSWGRMQLRPYAGDVIRGNFSGFRSGYITGKVDGNLLVFKWRQYTGEWGRAYLQMRPDGRLEGRWGYEEDASGGGHWRATRPSATPEESSPTSSEE
jgi:hypothetical protein